MACTQGAKYGYIWAASNFACFIFFYLFVPETKSRTLEEIDELFANKVSVHNFKAFETKIMDKALEDVRNKDKSQEETVTEHVDHASKN
jgi:hypothetical protein